MSGDVEEVLSGLGIPKEYSGTSSLANYKSNTITFLSKPKLVSLVKPNMSAMILVNKEIYESIKEIQGNNYLIVDEPYKIFSKIHNLIHRDKNNFLINQEGVHNSVVIGEHGNIGKNVKIMPYCVIGSNVKIGDNTIIRPNASIYNDVEIGKNCIIGPGVAIGEDGFGIVKDERGNNQRTIHLGKIIIGDNVEIGAQSTINRGTFKDTVIGDYVKIDNNVHIGHNIEIRKNTLICASSCVGGSTLIGENCWIGIGTTITDNIQIGDNVIIDINSVVVRNIPDDQHIAGFYAKDKLSWMMKEKTEHKKYKLNSK